jgi:hypothetical protein
MNKPFLQCPWCDQKATVCFDSDHGLWEIRQGFSRVSNRSLAHLERDWLEAHHPECMQHVRESSNTEQIASAPPPALEGGHFHDRCVDPKSSVASHGR